MAVLGHGGRRFGDGAAAPLGYTEIAEEEPTVQLL